MGGDRLKAWIRVDDLLKIRGGGVTVKRRLGVKDELVAQRGELVEELSAERLSALAELYARLG